MRPEAGEAVFGMRALKLKDRHEGCDFARPITIQWLVFRVVNYRTSLFI